jgi:hypothetical protein
MSYEGSNAETFDYGLNCHILWDIWCLRLELDKSLKIVPQGLTLFLLALEEIHRGQGFSGEPFEVSYDLVIEVLP